MVFTDRVDAGLKLAEHLGPLSPEEPVVLGLPRGGVPVAAVVAERLGAPLDVILVRKLGVPRQPELAMGAIGEGGIRVLNDEVVRVAGVSPDAIAAVEAHESAELQRRSRLLRGDSSPLDIAGRTVIVVDDGIATGATARAAIQVVRHAQAKSVVLAVPVAPPSAVSEMLDVADQVVCVETPSRFSAVGAWYRDFRPVTEREVIAALQDARLRTGPGQS